MEKKENFKAPKKKNIFFFSPEGFVPETNDVVKHIMDKSHQDSRELGKALKGGVDFKISYLNRIAVALNLDYLIIPIVDSPFIRRKINYFATVCDYFWKVPGNKIGIALSHFFSEISHIRNAANEVYTTLYELNRVATGAIRGGDKDKGLIETLKKCIKEIEDDRMKDIEG